MTTKEKDKMFILSAITLELFGWVEKNNKDYLDNYGMAHFYDMCADIVNEMLDGVEYQKYLIDKYHFHTNHKTSLDWYYMDKAPSMFTEERIRRVAGLDKMNLELSKFQIIFYDKNMNELFVKFTYQLEHEDAERYARAVLATTTWNDVSSFLINLI